MKNGCMLGFPSRITSLVWSWAVLCSCPHLGWLADQFPFAGPPVGKLSRTTIGVLLFGYVEFRTAPIDVNLQNLMTRCDTIGLSV